MFSESISNMMNQGGLSTAKDRISQIESMLVQYTKSVQAVPSSPQSLPNVSFSDYLKVKPEQELKFKLAEPYTSSRGEIEGLVKKAAQKYNIDSRLVLAVIKQESGFNPNARSGVGAQGLMQLMPETAQRLGITNAFDPAQNIEGGVKHLSGLLSKYRGNLILALAAYNAGGGNVDKYGGVPPFKETQNYVKSILANYLAAKPEGSN